MLLTDSFILSALYVRTKNLWICVMTHSLINVFTQLISGGSPYPVYISRAVIIILAVILAAGTDKNTGNPTAAE